MLQKRALEEEVYNVYTKQPRHLEPSDEGISVLEFSSLHTSKTECDGKPDGGFLSQVQACDKTEGFTPCSISNFSVIVSTTSEEDFPSSLVPSPGHCDFEFPATTIIHSREVYSYLFENPPQKLVPVGRDFQAELPTWVGRGRTISSSALTETSEMLNIVSESINSNSGDHLTDGDKFIGSCIIPMPDTPMCVDAENMVGAGRIPCSCDDLGSIRCVRQHVSESTNEIRECLGEEAFRNLGFCDMGEVVAEKWSNDEEDLFHEIVFRNAAFRRNFWDELASEFPLKTKKEIFSYYFNVFMLRKRAEQNRVDVLDIDSDNDAWEGVHGSADDIIEKVDPSDDSGDESPNQEDDFGCGVFYEINGSKSNNEVFTLRTSGYEAHENLDKNKCTAHMSETCFSNVFKNGSSGTLCQQLDRCVPDELHRHYVQKVCCQSGITGSATDVAMGKDHEVMRHWNGHESLVEHCSSKEWDVGYLPCSKGEDFLPTCSVIEEVFGSGICNYKT
ncbi:OLC1v1012249C1 [Oldenlandia corymbosa var. corymbosa]|uniref:OLC1v1012249C1 n=1 Tax=Oldenlandia corymbosa var. corymbosa TaxID=529605 RepID=A0AAV1DXX3_OLDCO|nr:OLC1v1012249C1 [Oldenlandia corymbosa var. corymbosa]